jgi:ribosomal protein S1
MIKVNKDNVEIKGNIIQIMAEMAKLIMEIKTEVLNSEEQLQNFDMLLLHCVRADDEIEFLADEERHWEKLQNMIAKLEKMEGDKQWVK